MAVVHSHLQEHLKPSVVKRVTCIGCGFQEDACHCWNAEATIAMAMREVRKRHGLSTLVEYYADRRGYIHELD